MKTDKKCPGGCEPPWSQNVPKGAPVKQITIGMPYHIDSVHLYLFDIGGDLVLFDTGPPTEEAQRGLRENIKLDQLRYVFVTHGHIDHYGLAAFLQRESGAKVILSRTATMQLRDKVHYLSDLTCILRELGFPEASAKLLIARFKGVSKMADLAENILMAEEAQTLMDKLGVAYVECPWHSQGDLVYLLDNYAITGDVALRGVFPVPMLDVDFTLPDRVRYDNYRAFCLSIARLKRMEGKVFLPSHKDHLKDLNGWIRFVVGKLLGRAKQVAPLREMRKSVYQAVSTLFGPPEEDPFRAYLKTSEVAFLYDFLQHPECLAEVLKQQQLYTEMETHFIALSRAS